MAQIKKEDANKLAKSMAVLRAILDLLATIEPEEQLRVVSTICVYLHMPERDRR